MTIPASKLIKKQQGGKPVDATPEMSPFRDITTSIIIPVIIHDQSFAEMTLKCLQHIGKSVDRNTTEVILVDNGSKMPAYYATDVYIKNPTTIGYGPAINQGIKLARGKYIVPMNNDVFVQEGWLEPLIEAVEADSTLGVIRPIQVGNGAYGAEKRKYGTPKVSVDQKDYHGFCYLMPRTVLEKVKQRIPETGVRQGDTWEYHYFDEQFRPGYCEDMDMWVRLTKAGYKMAKCTASEVEHLGGKTATALSAGDDNSFNAMLNTNRKKFFDKWGFDCFSEEWYTNWKELRAKFGEVA